METEPTEPGAFVLEGAQGDYSRNMNVVACGIRCGRLAAMTGGSLITKVVQAGQLPLETGH